jgi:hypothetical protein
MRKNLVVLLILSALIYESFEASCPNNCSGHGTCNSSTGQCTCQTNYQGTDCSIIVYPLQNGTLKTGQSVKSHEWIFYTITTTSGQGFIVEVRQDSSSMDVDLYLLRNSLPSLTNYEVSNTDFVQNFTVTVDNARTGVWYIGAYGYASTTFSIRINVSGTQCPTYNNCNPPKGQCVGPDQCQCTENYVGPDCSQQAMQLRPDVSVNGNVTIRKWVYYFINVTSQTNTLVFALNQSRADIDLDLYVRFGNVPTLDQWDYRDINMVQNFTLTILNTQVGVYYAGIYGYTAGSFSLKASVSANCLNQCSKHGLCSGTTCNCNSGYSGRECENMNVPLTIKTPVSGYAGTGAWNYYFFQTTSIATLSVTVVQTGPSGDCDLYARANSKPAITQYDYFDNGIKVNYTLDIPNPGESIWYFGVYGYTACDYSITVDVTNACPGTPVCSGHGTCSNGYCICNSGYSGDDCSSSLVTLSNGQVIIDTVPLNGWRYYSINTLVTTFLAVDLKETNSTGSVWLFVSKSIPPDVRTYDYADLHTNTFLHNLDITFPSPLSNQFFIGVYANPFALNPSGITFKITAWYSPF